MAAGEDVLESVTVHVGDREGGSLTRRLFGEQRLNSEIDRGGLTILERRRDGALEKRAVRGREWSAGSPCCPALLQRRRLVRRQVRQYLRAAVGPGDLERIDRG